MHVSETLKFQKTKHVGSCCLTYFVDSVVQKIFEIVDPVFPRNGFNWITKQKTSFYMGTVGSLYIESYTNVESWDYGDETI